MTSAHSPLMSSPHDIRVSLFFTSSSLSFQAEPQIRLLLLQHPRPIPLTLPSPFPFLQVLLHPSHAGLNSQHGALGVCVCVFPELLKILESKDEAGAA